MNEKTARITGRNFDVEITPGERTITDILGDTVKFEKNDIAFMTSANRKLMMPKGARLKNLGKDAGIKKWGNIFSAKTIYLNSLQGAIQIESAPKGKTAFTAEGDKAFIANILRFSSFDDPENIKIGLEEKSTDARVCAHLEKKVNSLDVSLGQGRVYLPGAATKGRATVFLEEGGTDNSAISLYVSNNIRLIINNHRGIIFIAPEVNNVQINNFKGRVNLSLGEIETLGAEVVGDGFCHTNLTEDEAWLNITGEGTTTLKNQAIKINGTGESIITAKTEKIKVSVNGQGLIYASAALSS